MTATRWGIFDRDGLYESLQWGIKALPTTSFGIGTDRLMMPFGRRNDENRKPYGSGILDKAPGHDQGTCASPVPGPLGRYVYPRRRRPGPRSWVTIDGRPTLIRRLRAEMRTRAGCGNPLGTTSCPLPSHHAAVSSQWLVLPRRPGSRRPVSRPPRWPTSLRHKPTCCAFRLRRRARTRSHIRTLSLPFPVAQAASGMRSRNLSRVSGYSRTRIPVAL
jgi:hypothetical protein